jgi:anti-anti-sigma factor
MEGDHSAGSFSVRSDHPVPGTVVVRVRGALDYLTAPRLRAAIAEQLVSRPRVLIIDLDGVAFLDTVGLAELVEVHVAGPDVRIVCSTPRPLRTLQISGLADWFHMSDSVTGTAQARPTTGLEPA